MSVPVEAQSISALSNLFAYPPQYPRNPTHEVREPLVLYIVRVPGSKDVFLTPLKPPTKSSISLEAIQSSLYYLHVANEEDEEVKQSIDVQRRSEEAGRVNPPIHRKPLPPTPYTNYPPSERPLPPSKSCPHYQPTLNGDVDASQFDRYVARGAHLRFTSEPVGQNQINRKHTPSPQRARPEAEAYTQHSQFPSQYTRPAEYVLHHSLVPRQDSFGSEHSSVESRQLGFEDNLSNSGTLPTYSTGQFFSTERRHGSPRDHLRPAVAITLIRRDPVSGCQWNVGNITVDQTGSSRMPLNPVSIEITTPGYGKFASTSEIARPGTGYKDADSIKEALTSGRLASAETFNNSESRHSFVSVAEYHQQPVHNQMLRQHQRSNSSNSLRSTSPTKQPRQVYSFTSPWQGLCSFSNSIDGRSLKCRHSLSSSSTEQNTTENVAELRFNLPRFILANSSEKEPENGTLPISKLLGPRSGREALRRKIRHGLDKVSRDFDNRTSSSEEQPALSGLASPSGIESDLDRLSLSLGREKAGGGFKGTSAKLGKLIIEDEGLKMCDLVVAACMGVWWQHYEGKDD